MFQERGHDKLCPDEKLQKIRNVEQLLGLQGGGQEPFQ